MKKLYYSDFILSESLKPHEKPKNSYVNCPFCNELLIGTHLFYTARDHDMFYEMSICENCGWWDLFYEEWGMQDYPEEFSYYEAILKNLSNDVSYEDLNTINELKVNPDKLYDLSPRKTEEIMKGIMSSYMDCDLEMTKQTRDGGKDLIGFESNEGKFIIEIKRYRKDRKVGVNLVRQLLGAMVENSTEHGILVTTSTFSKDAFNLCDNINDKGNWLLKLNDYQDICSWLKLYDTGMLDYRQLEEKLNDSLFRFPFGQLERIM